MSNANSAAKAVDRAVTRIRRYGLDGPRPIEEIEALLAHGDAVNDALRQALDRSLPDRLPATVHLVRLLRAAEVSDAVADAALRRPASLAAKREAIETLRESGLEVPVEVERILALADALLRSPDADSLAAVLELPDAWRDPILEAWLTGEEAIASDLCERLLGITADIDLLAIEQLGAHASPGSVPVLLRLSDDPDRTVAKAAKRALHRLRSAGVSVDEPAEKAFSLRLEPDTRRESSAFVTSVDGGGGRIVWLLTPSASGGLRLLEVVVGDQAGIARAETMSVTRKGFRQHVAKLRENPAILVGQVGVEEAVDILRRSESSADAGSAGDRSLPEAYRRWRAGDGADLFAAQDPDGAGADDPASIDSATDEGRALLRQSVDLLGEPYFSNWAFVGEATRTAAVAVREAETSKLVIDEEQRKRQVDQAISGVADAFDAATRNLYQQRLAAMAALLASMRESEKAELAAAAASGFVGVADLYADHPFARALIQRGVLAEYQSLREREERESGDSRIARP